jgi:hypothetical protein
MQQRPHPSKDEKPMAQQPTTNSTNIEPALYCRHCGYELRGLVIPPFPKWPCCPECGKDYNPNDPDTYRRKPIRYFRWYVKRTAILLLTIVLLLTAAWAWFFWGWYSEQKVLTTLKIPPSQVSYIPMFSFWPREHLRFADFALERVDGVVLDSRTNIVDISLLSRLQKLQWLHLVGRKVDDISPVTLLKSLEVIQLYDTSVTDLSPLAGMENLNSVSIHGTKAVDVVALGHLTNLRILDLDDTPTMDISPLAGLSKLRALSLCRTNVTELSSLTGLADLRMLRIEETSTVRDISPLIHLTNLEELYLRGTSITDISPLLKLKRLRWLNVPWQTINETQAEELRRALPDCSPLRE